MSQNETAPFQRGRTLYNGATIDTNNLLGLEWEGKEWLFTDMRWGSSPPLKRSNHSVRCRVIRWMNSAVNALPKRVCSFASTAGLNASRSAGFTTTTAQDALGVIDEFLPAAGCPVNDLCWVVVDGPSETLTPLEADANNVINVNTRVVALTAVTSGATTAGRVRPQTIAAATTGDGSAIADMVQNVLGRAMTARTTANTGNAVLIYVGKF